MKDNWKLLHSQEKYRDNILSIEHREIEFQKINLSMPFTVINTKDWVIIIPINKDKTITMVKQYRAATEETTIEFPGGAINKDEDIDNSALRELEEETGLIPEKITLLGKITPNPALLSNSCFAYLAEGCEFKSKTDFDLFEDIEIKNFTQNEIEQMMIDGKITHSLVLAAYNLYKLKK
jgi:8-oxo-dGTP pyrophosphatase MutT (NUDIX family)